jgi:hypothetical protein
LRNLREKFYNLRREARFFLSFVFLTKKNGSLTISAKLKEVEIFVTAVFSCRNGFTNFRQLKQPLLAEIVKEPKKLLKLKSNYCDNY